MNTNELRAAAEAVLKIYRPRLKHSYLTATDTEWVVRFAESYLAEHPADDEEPATEEWLLSVGLSMSVHLGERWTLILSPGSGNAVITNENLDAYYGWYEEYDLPALKTRGDVRRLCGALGVPLKEGSEQR